MLRELGFSDFTLAINHRELLRGLIRGANIELSQESSALIAVDKLDKIGADGVRDELAKRGIEASRAARLVELVTLEADDNASLLATLRDTLATDAAAVKAIDDLTELLKLLDVTPAADHARISPKLARGLSYYTGPIFEVSVPDFAGSIAGGGRYDELVGMFGKKKVPAMGLALGFERLVLIMGQRGLYPELLAGPQVMLCSMDVSNADVLRVAHQLRAQGLKVEVYPDAAKLGKQLQYADAPGVSAPFAAIVGATEIAAGTVTLKRLSTGEQQTLAIADVAAHIAGP
ncbi:MAG: histidine--tRNA ligase family protein [Nannocystaceae bacterium]|nr:histidine--tRNA ligase family protein [Nannocystaceae bacterium]